MGERPLLPDGRACEKCARVIPRGGLAYVIRLEAFADFDGYLTDEGDDLALETKMRQLVRQMSEEDPDDLIRDVYVREVHLLCKDCRDRVLANPLNLPLPEGLP